MLINKKNSTNFVDKTGQRFGRLTVISRGPNGSNWKVKWFCQCDCGKKTLVKSDSLCSSRNKSITNSCGCLQKEAASKNGKQGIKSLESQVLNSIVTSYKKRASYCNVIFDLKRDFILQMIQKQCFYCGSLPSNCYTRPRIKDKFFYNGLDRKIPSKGYTVDNVVTACIMCNIAKLDYSIEEFKSWIKRTYQHMETYNV